MEGVGDKKTLRYVLWVYRGSKSAKINDLHKELPLYAAGMLHIDDVMAIDDDDDDGADGRDDEGDGDGCDGDASDDGTVVMNDGCV